MELTYEQFEIASSLEESMDFNLDSVGNMDGGSLNDERSGLKFEANNGRNPSLSIDASDDESFVMKTLDTETIDGTITIENVSSPNG